MALSTNTLRTRRYVLIHPFDRGLLEILFSIHPGDVLTAIISNNHD